MRFNTPPHTHNFLPKNILQSRKIARLTNRIRNDNIDPRSMECIGDMMSAGFWESESIRDVGLLRRWKCWAVCFSLGGHCGFDVFQRRQESINSRSAIRDMHTVKLLAGWLVGVI